ncbi:MAG: EAL domain-containing protein, partial [Mariprofundus sp.]|nr:EAL domain-containing protein [Mariprofundus sp.]
QAGLHIRMAVNLSARQLQDKELLSMLARMMKEFAIEPGMLELELTESCLMENPESSSQLMHDIKQLNLRLAMDDFGTGYSSLSYLKRFAMDTLKSDRSFVQDLPHDEQDAAIATTIIAMARNLGLKVLAEGVETVEQLQFLQEHGCDEVQGYYFSRPLPAEEVQPLLKKHMLA